MKANFTDPNTIEFVSEHPAEDILIKQFIRASVMETHEGKPALAATNHLTRLERDPSGLVIRLQREPIKFYKIVDADA